MTYEELLVEIKLAKANGKAQEKYEKVVNFLIRQHYTLSEELAIQRQRYEKPEEFDAYYRVCEGAKAEAKRLLGLDQ